MTIKIAHDFICPWCWIGWIQAKRLEEEFGTTLEWVGYELWPEELAWPEAVAPVEPPANRPSTPTRLDFLKYIEGIEIPSIERPKQMRTHNAHLAIEFAKTIGAQDQLVEAFYKAYWQAGLNINDVEVIARLAGAIVPDVQALRNAISTDAGAENIIHFDEAAYASGVYNVPTFFIGADSLAEQPYGVLKSAAQRHVQGVLV